MAEATPVRRAGKRRRESDAETAGMADRAAYDWHLSKEVRDACHRWLMIHDERYRNTRGSEFGFGRGPRKSKGGQS